jgi:integrase
MVLTREVQMRQRTNDQKTKITRKAKISALAERPGTPGEQTAATAALDRIAGAAVAERPAPRVEHLDTAVIKRLPVPASGYVIHWDDEVAGFGIRVTAGGSKAFIFNYRVKGGDQQRRITIGQFRSWTTGAARTEAKRLEHLVDGGNDPRGDFEKKRKAPTMAELCDRFVAEHLPRKRPATADSYKRVLRLHIRPFFGGFTKVADVSFEDVDKLHQKVTATGSTYAANRCVAILSKMFSLAIKWKMRTDNPARGIERNVEVKRTRYLTGDELARLMAALATHSSDRRFADIIRLLLLTGARRGEILAMRWADIDLAKGTWTKPGSATKQKTTHHAFLSAPARLLLTEMEIHSHGEFVFPSDGKTGHIVEVKNGWASLCERAGIENLRIHDLRHSFASQLVSSGHSLELIGALLGHSNPATTARYSHLFTDVQKAAVEKVGAIVNGAGGP